MEEPADSGTLPVKFFVVEWVKESDTWEQAQNRRFEIGE